MRSVMIVAALALSLLGASEVFELNWDGNLCATSSDQQRQIVRKALRDGACTHPIGTGKVCTLSGHLNAKGAYYDGKLLVLIPYQPRERALAIFRCGDF